jgi:maleylpyruvate isomerase
MRQGTDLVLAAVAGLTADELREPSRLPGWTRAHVVGHLARNAEALGRLAHWAATGEETPMYPSLEARAEGIEASVANEAAVLRADLRAAAAELERRLAAFDDAAWTAIVRYGTGELIPASELPWARCREIWLHAIDLGAGITTRDFPPELTDALLEEFVGRLDAKVDCPALVLRPTDREEIWTLGSAGETTEVSGPAGELLAWLCGRGPSGLEPAELPALPAWG